MEASTAIRQQIRGKAIDRIILILPLFVCSVLFWAWIVLANITFLFLEFGAPAGFERNLTIVFHLIILGLVIRPVFAMFCPIFAPSFYLSMFQGVTVVNEHPDFAGLVSEVNALARRAGLGEVRYIGIQAGELNAFAFGFFPSRMAVVIGDDLLQLLRDQPDQLRAVIGYEIGHLASGDTVLSTMIMICRETFRLGFVVPVVAVCGWLGIGAREHAGPHLRRQSR